MQAGRWKSSRMPMRYGGGGACGARRHGAGSKRSGEGFPAGENRRAVTRLLHFSIFYVREEAGKILNSLITPTVDSSDGIGLDKPTTN